MKKFYIETYGCSRRYLDAERISNYFHANGIKKTMKPEEADYLMLVTCGLTKRTEDEVIGSIARLKRSKGKMLVYGCLPAMNLDRLKTIYDRDMLITRDIDRIDEFFTGFSKKFKDIDDANEVKSILPYSFLKRVSIRFFIHPLCKFTKLNLKEGLSGGFGLNRKTWALRISEGCSGSCSYCNIRKAIGSIRSKTVPELLREVDKGLAKRKFDIHIVSSDSGAYGLDIGSNLPELLNAILKKDDRIKIGFIQDLHPYYVHKYRKQLVELFKTRRIGSILTAVQSGNPRILRLMRRWDDIDNFRETLRQIKDSSPDLRVMTQVIVGFPSETEEEFLDTLSYVNNCGFDEVDIFAYHESLRTDSSAIMPKVAPAVIIERTKRMGSALNMSRRILL
ncbi:MAG: radical SAM protein [Candidatus Omnitrophota bacterium]|jgi:tRNA A37 methylthiotransferase MiaB